MECKIVIATEPSKIEDMNCVSVKGFAKDVDTADKVMLVKFLVDALSPDEHLLDMIGVSCLFNFWPDGELLKVDGDGGLDISDDNFTDKIADKLATIFVELIKVRGGFYED